jgi:hypothetical protein
LDDRIGFLHIGKTGGTALLSALSNTIDVTVFHHHATLRQAVEAYPDIKMIFIAFGSIQYQKLVQRRLCTNKMVQQLASRSCGAYA